MSETKPKASDKPKRLTGRRLQRIRADWFYRYPLCERCRKAKPQRIRPATQLDHIKPLEQGGDDFDCDGEQNRQGLCDDCHAEKTAEDMGYVQKVAAGLDGWPVGSGGPRGVLRVSGSSDLETGREPNSTHPQFGGRPHGET